MSRKLKQTIIALVYFLLFAGMVYLVYKAVYKSSCTDGTQNGKEEGVDCGGVCPMACKATPVLAKIQVGPVYVVADSDAYDVAAEIVNPNTEYGLYHVAYTVALYNKDIKFSERKGETYILPNQKRYLIELGVRPKATITRGEITIDNYDFREFKDSQKPKLEILNKTERYVREPGNYFETKFQVANRSGYSFHKVDLEVVLKDGNGKIVAMNKANINGVNSGSVRDFRFFWPREIHGDIIEGDVRAEANVFDLGNFIK